MGTLRPFVIAFAMTALSASAFAQRVSYDYRRGQDFSRLKTFTFRETPPIDQITAETTLFDDPLTKEQTEAAIARQLQARGMVRDDEHPDVIITTRRSFQTQYVVNGGYGWWGWNAGYPYPYGYGYSYGGPWYSYPVTEGTLTIDVLNADGQLLWRGLAERTVREHQKPAERAEHINKDVVKAFRKFPGTLSAVATTGQEVPKPR